VAREGAAVEDVNEARPMADVHMKEIDLLTHPNRPRLVHLKTEMRTK
jgi:hypothetical protein